MTTSDTAPTQTPPAPLPVRDVTPQPLEGAIAARRLRHLSEIGLALSAERNIKKLLELILSASCELTTADGGTLYIVEKSKSGEKSLFFRAAKNDSIVVDTNMSFAVSPSSLAGYVALAGEMLRFDDVYHLSPDAPYKFNSSFDLEHGYKTQSILVIPLKDHNGEVIGVLQLINRKRHREALLNNAEIVEHEVIPFDDEMAVLAATLASQAAVALNNTLLVREIEELFEAMVVASSTAIEDRDPSTSGHSRRVTNLTLALAKAVSEAEEGPLSHIHFSDAQMKELRYAALLHDFGKIGVRENVLVKSHKIEPPYFEAIQNRILALRGQWEAEGIRLQMGMMREQSLSEDERSVQIEAAEAELAEKIARLDADAVIATKLNDPTEDGLSGEEWEEAQKALDRLQALSFRNVFGKDEQLLHPSEATALQVRRGSLTADEFRQIQDHAQMSYEFLKQIPWTAALENVPIIARSHHERGDGTGYPQGLKNDQIPFASKLMAISDVYDALTASDRPYKRAMSPERAIQILGFEAQNGKMDPDALKIFIECEIYKQAGE